MIRLAITLLAPWLLPPAGVAAQQTTSCADLPEYGVLDFWVGEWDVFVGAQQVGVNRIEKVLGGCALTEHWTDARGRLGQSFFYYAPLARRWQQVWVTETPGAVKEKHLVSRDPTGGVRFLGETLAPDGTRVLDRTTLTPEGDGRVRQVIDVSADGGATWRTTFDAIYVPRR